MEECKEVRIKERNGSRSTYRFIEEGEPHLTTLICRGQCEHVPSYALMGGVEGKGSVRNKRSCEKKRGWGEK